MPWFWFLDLPQPSLDAFLPFCYHQYRATTTTTTLPTLLWDVLMPQPDHLPLHPVETLHVPHYYGTLILILNHQHIVLPDFPGYFFCSCCTLWVNANAYTTLPLPQTADSLYLPVLPQVILQVNLIPNLLLPLCVACRAPPACPAYDEHRFIMRYAPPAGSYCQLMHCHATAQFWICCSAS